MSNLLTQHDHYGPEAYKITLSKLHFDVHNLAMLMSLSETTSALQRCRVTEIIDCHLVLKSVSFCLSSSSFALFASLFNYPTACLLNGQNV